MNEMDKLNETVQNLQMAFAANNHAINRLALSQATGKTFSGKRDLYEVFGYELEPQYDNYASKYLRQDISKRIINAMPDSIWTRSPTIEEDGETEDQTEFERSFEEMAKRLKLYHYMNRLDKLAGIGRYSVLLIGLNDGLQLSQQASSIQSLDNVIYLMPFSENNAIIQNYVEDPANPRYGLPEMYKLTTGGYQAGKNSTLSSQTHLVHHSRVIHVAEGLIDNDVFGTPKLECVINRLEDLEKVVGGSAEIFWINGRSGLNLNVDKDASVTDSKKLNEHIDNYVHQLTRVLKTQGIDVKTLDLMVHRPDYHVSVILDLISGATGIPKRILVGSERGELASSQDEKNWLSRIEERRENHCEPMMLAPFIDKLVSLTSTNLPNGYNIVWPELAPVTEEERAEIATKKSNAIATYANSLGADLLVTPKQFVEDILGMEFREDDINEMQADEDRQIEQDDEDAQ